MGGVFAPLAVLIIIILGPFIALQAYLLVWFCGPAIRRAGKCWEEGRQRVIADRQAELSGEYWRGCNDAWSGRVVPAVSVAPVPSPDSTAAPAKPQKYSITGRELP